VARLWEPASCRRFIWGLAAEWGGQGQRRQIVPQVLRVAHWSTPRGARMTAGPLQEQAPAGLRLKSSPTDDPYPARPMKL